MFSETTRERIGERLRFVYGDDVGAVAAEKLDGLAEKWGRTEANLREQTWTEQDAVLITYGDQVRTDGEPPLRTLGRFLGEAGLEDGLSTIHILPCFPYSSDDGFSVIDYRVIDPNLGDWDDVAALGESYELAFDLVLNHCSAEGEWFAKYKAGEPPYDGYFIEVDPATDLSGVTRPRSLPLLTPVETSRGTKNVWTTFSADQVDLNFANPDVLVEMLDVLLMYAFRGGRVIRLDAIAYLWKEIGTSCIHLPKTHAVVKLMRDVLDDLAPGTLLLSETNVPHAENVSYFGDGDEAQMVYNFSLAPLLLDAMLSREATPLKAWLADLEPAAPGTYYFNFTASHDGIGVRPLEGLVEPERLGRLVEAVRARGGRVNMRRKPDGSESPYELNIAYFSAVGDPDGLPADEHADRFLATQAFQIALRGVPGIYFHSLVGTPNDLAGMERTGHNRTINRRKFELGELTGIVGDESSAQHRVLDGYRRLLTLRGELPALHPESPQEAIPFTAPGLVGFTRGTGDDRVCVVLNVSETPQPLDEVPVASQIDRITGTEVESVPPFRTVWL